MSDPYGENAPYVSDPTHFPADPDMEYALIGTLRTNPELLPEISYLDPPDWYVHGPRAVYARMLQLQAEGKVFDGEIGMELIADRDPELLGVCLKAQEYWVSPLMAKHYAAKLKDLAEKRRMLPLLGKLSEMSYNGVSAESILDTMQEEIAQRRGRVPGATPFDRWPTQAVSATEAARLGVIERIYLVEDFLRDKSLAIFYGAPGEFKSALAMDLAICIANGNPWLTPLPVEGNTQRSLATVQCRVLWLNYDQSHDDVLERLGAMTRAYRREDSLIESGENFDAISHSDPPATLKTEAQARALGAWCAAQGYRVLFVDCLLDVKGEADLQSEEIGEVLRRWRIVCDIGSVSVVLIHHTNKANEMFGSRYISAKLDHQYLISRPEGTDTVVIESKKERSFSTGKLYARWCYQHWAGSRTLHTARFFGDSTEQRTAHPNNTTQDAILKVLMAAPGRGFTPIELLAVLNENRDEEDQLKAAAVYNAARRLSENERNVGKGEVDGNVVYHYGELITSA